MAHFNIYAPMLRMDVWKSIAGERWRELMCLACMVARLGRPLIPQWDFRNPWWRYQRLPSKKPPLQWMVRAP